MQSKLLNYRQNFMLAVFLSLFFVAIQIDTWCNGIGNKAIHCLITINCFFFFIFLKRFNANNQNLVDSRYIFLSSYLNCTVRSLVIKWNMCETNVRKKITRYFHYFAIFDWTGVLTTVARCSARTKPLPASAAAAAHCL